MKNVLSQLKKAWLKTRWLRYPVIVLITTLITSHVDKSSLEPASKEAINAAVRAVLAEQQQTKESGFDPVDIINEIRH